MNRLTLFVEQSNAGIRLEYVAESAGPDGSIVGRFVNQSKPWLPFVLPSKEGKLYTFKTENKYKVTELTAKGKFKLVPSSN